MLPNHALRQSVASLFAYALTDLFPSAQLMDCELDQVGFTYQFFLDQPLEQEILSLLEEKMRSLVKLDLPFLPTEMMRENACDLFRHRKQERRAEIVSMAPYNIVPILKIGAAFYDYGHPPYVSSAEELRAFKLQALEPSKNQPHAFKVTGTVSSDLKSLKKFLKKYEEAKKNDHRLLGRELQLFAHHEDLGKSGWVWYPKGAFIREALLEWWRQLHRRENCLFVATPRVIEESFLKKSGYLGSENKQPLTVGDHSVVAPGLGFLHAHLFRSQLHSYRDLPVRYTECAEIHWDTDFPSSGLFNSSTAMVERTHIFCTSQQLYAEIISSLQFIEKTVTILGFECQWILCPRGAKFAGTIENWDTVLEKMQSALQECKIDFHIDAERGAFSGPQIMVRIKDALGREWDGPFIKADFNCSERLGIRYQGSDDQMHAPFMMTQSMFGSLERYIALLVERCAGIFPLWLAPEQVRLLPIAKAHHDYAEMLCANWVKAGIRCRVDYRQEPLGAKVHAVEREKIPYAIIIGDKEEKENVINVRSCNKHGKIKRMKIDDFLQILREEIVVPSQLSKDTEKSYSEE